MPISPAPYNTDVQPATSDVPNQIVQPAQTATDVLSGGVGGVNNQAPVQSPITPTAPPQHHSFMSDILGAIGDVLGGPKTRSTVDPNTGQVVQQDLDRRQRIANTAAIYLRGAGAGAAQHGPGAVGKAALAGAQEQQQTQQQQFQNTQQESQNTQQQIMNRATIAKQNNETLLAWRRYDMASAEQKHAIDASDASFALQMQQAGAAPVPMMVDGKDVNGTSDENAIMQYMTQHPKPPDGMDYVPTRKTDANGKQTYTVLQVPHDAMNDMVTIPTKDAKDLGIPVKTSGDTVTLKRGALVAARGANLNQLNVQSEMDARQENLKREAAAQKSTSALQQSEIEKNQAQAKLAKSQTFDENDPLIDEIGSGKMVPERLGYVLARKPEILRAVAAKYPDFDASKAQSYADVYKQFTSTKPGTAGYSLNAGGTALQHLHELDQLNTPASHIPHTPAWTKYQNKVDTVASELAKFYGDSTIPAIASIKDTLASTLPGNRRAAITTQVQSMGRKLDAYEQQWTNAAPSKSYEAPLPNVSDAAKAARADLDPEYAQRIHPANQGGGMPAGATHVVPGPDGKNHYTNAQGTVDYGVAP